MRDNGRGIPVDIEPRTGLTGVEVVFTKLHAGGKFGGGSYTASGGLHGVGASVVNAVSARLDVEVDRGGKTYAMSFRRGEPGYFPDVATDDKAPDHEFTPYERSSELAVVGKAKRGVTGSRIRYWADEQIFLKDAEFDYDGLVARARQTSFLIPGLTLVIRDERRKPGTAGESATHIETLVHDGGISEFAEFLAPDAAVTDVWRLQGTGTFTETVPVLDANGHMSPTAVERECAVDVAVRWGTGYDAKVSSFVNIISTPKGGTHLAGFEQALLKVFRKQLEVNSRRLKVGSDKPEKDDVLAGLTAVVTVRLAEPQFEGQTKEVLGTNAVRAIVAKVVEQELTARITSTKRGEKAQAALLLEKVVSEMKSRISARLHKETQRRKNALETSSLPAKLADCRSTDVEKSELFIVEGDSALGTAKLARSSDYQALLPIRGKILNVQKASVSDMLKNAECAAIIQVIGAGSGRSFDLDVARYGKVIIMTDADVDGAHIRTLLLTLFFRYMRPLVEAGQGVCRRAPAAPHRGRQPRLEEERAHLHLLREGDAHDGRLPRQARQEHQAAAAALQGPRRDGRRPAGRDHDGPAAPHAAQGDPARRRGGRAGLRAAHGQRRRAPQGLHRRLGRRAGPRAHRRLTAPSGRRRPQVCRDAGAARHTRRLSLPRRVIWATVGFCRGREGRPPRPRRCAMSAAARSRHGGRRRPSSSG